MHWLHSADPYLWHFYYSFRCLLAGCAAVGGLCRMFPHKEACGSVFPGAEAARTVGSTLDHLGLLLQRYLL